jgi:hypothetical protein
VDIPHARQPSLTEEDAIELARALRAHNGVKTSVVSVSVSAQAMPTDDEWKTVFGAAGISVVCGCNGSLSADQRARAVLLHFLVR